LVAFIALQGNAIRSALCLYKLSRLELDLEPPKSKVVCDQDNNGVYAADYEKYIPNYYTFPICKRNEVKFEYVF
jgi:hypothetical protein